MNEYLSMNSISSITTYSQTMRSTLRQGCFFLLLFALCFSFVSCDSGGSNSSPDWTGTWELSESRQNFEGYHVSLSKEEVRVAFIFGALGCRANTLSVTNIDGNVITTDEDGGTEVELDVSGDTMTATDLVEEDDAAEFTRVDSDPSDLDTLRDLACN
jgi:hypothetical protein